MVATRNTIRHAHISHARWDLGCRDRGLASRAAIIRMYVSTHARTTHMYVYTCIHAVYVHVHVYIHVYMYVHCRDLLGLRAAGSFSIGRSLFVSSRVEENKPAGLTEQWTLFSSRAEEERTGRTRPFSSRVEEGPAEPRKDREGSHASSSGPRLG